MLPAALFLLPRLRLSRARALGLAEKATVVHVSAAPLVLTLLTESDANVGLVIDAVPRLSAAVESMRAAAEASAARATMSSAIS